MLWTTDHWQTKTTTASAALGYAGHRAVLPVLGNAAATLEFALHWTEGDRWTASNYTLAVG